MLLSRRSSNPAPKLPNRRRSSLDQPLTPKVPSRRASLDPHVLSKPQTINGSRNPKPTVSSLGKQIHKKEPDLPLQNRLRKAPSRNPTNPRNEKGEVEAMASSLPMDSLCLCLEKLPSVYHVVTCASVCRHWREAVLSDVVSPGVALFSQSEILGLRFIQGWKDVYSRSVE